MSATPPTRPKFGGRHRLLLGIERFSREHYKLVFLIALLAVVGAVWLGSKIKIESDLLKLIPVGNVQVDTLKEALLDFGSVDYLLVLMPQFLGCPLRPHPVGACDRETEPRPVS